MGNKGTLGCSRCNLKQQGFEIESILRRKDVAQIHDDSEFEYFESIERSENVPNEFPVNTINSVPSFVEDFAQQFNKMNQMKPSIRNKGLNKAFSLLNDNKDSLFPSIITPEKAFGHYSKFSPKTNFSRPKVASLSSEMKFEPGKGNSHFQAPKFKPGLNNSALQVIPNFSDHHFCWEKQKKLVDKNTKRITEDTFIYYEGELAKLSYSDRFIIMPKYCKMTNNSFLFF